MTGCDPGSHALCRGSARAVGTVGKAPGPGDRDRGRCDLSRKPE